MEQQDSSDVVVKNNGDAGCMVIVVIIVLYILIGAFVAGICGLEKDQAIQAALVWPLYLAWKIGSSLYPVPPIPD
jgi:hypothetical protein